VALLRSCRRVNHVRHEAQARLHDIYNRGGDIDRALRAIINEAVATEASLVEIIPGKGSGALKKRVLRFLEQEEVKSQYQRVEKDSNNFGRIFVHFRWK
jgi:DNA-nicking Smr family endonuclease